MSDPVLSVVVAVKQAQDNVPAILAALASAAPEVELIFCVSGTPHPALLADPRVAVVTAPAESLIPHLWRDGIVRARGQKVAVTTAECIPAPDWLDRMRRADLARWVAVGGIIDNDPAAGAKNWAIYFLRYSAFAPPLAAGPTDEVAADNAVYDRAAILEHPDLLRLGFWEPSFHARFRAAGRQLAIDPALVVVHHGLVTAGDFVHQRHAHGHEYGLARAETQSLAQQLLLLARSPLVAAVILARVYRRIAAKPRYRRHLIRATPWLLLFVGAWASGEARGYAAALGKRQAGTALQHARGGIGVGAENER